MESDHPAQVDIDTNIDVDIDIDIDIDIDSDIDIDVDIDIYIDIDIDEFYCTWISLQSSVHMKKCHGKVLNNVRPLCLRVSGSKKYVVN